MTPIEKLFYKYQKISDGDKNHALENLSKNQLYFSDPNTFNDPFDCKIYLNAKGTEEQWINLLCEERGYNRNKVIEEVNDFEREDGLVYPRVNRRTVGFPRICCFSEINDSILMWSHYADNHKGICLSFRARKIINGNKEYSMRLYAPNSDINAPISGLLKEITYNNDNIPMLNIFDNPNHNNRIAEERLFTKFSDWVYEKEYRIPLPEHRINKSGILEYFKKDLEGVIFGLKISHENAKLVYETVKENYLDEGITVNFYEAKEVPSKYAVEIEPIDNVEKYIDSLPKSK